MSSPSDGMSGLQAFSMAVADLVETCLPRTCTVLVRSANLIGAGNGSGWCYDATHVVTNSHVVDEAGGLVNVRFPGQQVKKGRVLGSDPLTDLAVIKVDSCDVAPLEVRVDPPLRVGESCLTVGAPDGLEESVSLGIVSALHRQINLGDVKFEEAIQTDAAVNPGNSGGPLLDMWGRVIGVNFLKLLGQGVTQGNPLTQISFAIPSEMVVDLVPELIEHGRIERASIGVTISQVPVEISGRVAGAVKVQRVLGDSALRPGDVIMSCNDTPIARRYDLMRLLRRSVIGTDLALRVLRDGSEVEVRVTASARTATPD